MIERHDRREPEALDADDAASSLEEVRRLDLLEEVPDVRVTRQTAGTVTVKREVQTRRETIQLELVTETLVITRDADAHDTGGADTTVVIDGEPLAPGEERRVIVYREEADVRAVATIHEHVRILKKRVVEHRAVPLELRKEVMRVETEGDVVVHHEHPDAPA